MSLAVYSCFLDFLASFIYLDLNYINLSKKFREFKKESKVGIKIKKEYYKKEVQCE